MSNTTNSPASERLALSAAEVAKLLGISQRHLWAMHASGRLGPLPVRFGRAVRWNAAELAAWLDAGAPPRDRWLAQRHGGDTLRKDANAADSGAKVYCVLSLIVVRLAGAIFRCVAPRAARLAMLCLLLDGTATSDTARLLAALAVWGYGKQSALYIIVVSGTPDDPADDGGLAAETPGRGPN